MELKDFVSDSLFIIAQTKRKCKPFFKNIFILLSAHI